MPECFIHASIKTKVDDIWASVSDSVLSLHSERPKTFIKNVEERQCRENVATYKAACKRMRTIPTSYVERVLLSRSSDVLLKNHGLEEGGIRALAIALVVITEISIKLLATVADTSNALQIQPVAIKRFSNSIRNALRILATRFEFSNFF